MLNNPILLKMLLNCLRCFLKSNYKRVSSKTQFSQSQRLSMVRKSNYQISEKGKIALLIDRPTVKRMDPSTNCWKIRTLKTMTMKIIMVKTRISSLTLIHCQMIPGCHRNLKAQQLERLIKLKRKSEVPTWVKGKEDSFKTVKVLSNADWRNRTSLRDLKYK